MSMMSPLTCEIVGTTVISPTIRSHMASHYESGISGTGLEGVLSFRSVFEHGLPNAGFTAYR